MRDGFLAVVAVLLLAAGWPGPARARSDDGPPPLSVVVFVADDLGAADIGPYGSTEVCTPNLNRLARDSLLFTAAFAASPTCAPSRAAMLTGRMPFRNGAHANHTGIRRDIPTLPACVKAAGLRTAIAGKYHIGPPDAYPFELIHGTNVPEPGHEADGVLWTDLGMEPVHRWLAGTAERNERFVLIVNDHSPHVIWPEADGYKPEDVSIPPQHLDTPETRRARARYYTDISKMDRNLGSLLDSLSGLGLAKRTVVIFTADQGPQWPFGKWNLYDSGVRVPLIIRWPGVTDGGRRTDALASLVDLLPTVVEMTGGTPPPDLDGHSLVPVILGRSGGAPRAEVFATHTGDGTMNRSPARMIRTRRFKLITNLAPAIPFTTHIDRATDHDGGREYWPSWVARGSESGEAAALLRRYHHRPAVELYDIQSDPHELRNLADDPEFSGVRRDLLNRLSRWREQQEDRETGPHEPETPGRPGTTPYIFR